jgi:type II secretory pathway component GspD/PulD (secretin)
MKKLLALALLTVLPLGAISQTSPITVTISSKGQDVRPVVHDLFEQAKKSYVLEPNVHFVLYLSLRDVEFEEALMTICKTASLSYELQNGVYYISKAKPKTAPATPKTTPPTENTESKTPPASKPADKAPVSKGEEKNAPAKETSKTENKPPVTSTTGKSAIPVSAEVLKRVLTIKFAKTDIKTVFAEIAKQTRTEITLDKKVPAYRLDAIFKGSSLKYTLDKICSATSLTYKISGDKVTISPK